MAEDDVFPTRLGEPQLTWVLARREGQNLRWWSDDPDHRRAEALSEVSVSTIRSRRTGIDDAQDAPGISALTRHWKEWQHAARRVAVIDQDGWIVDGVRYDRELGLVLPPSRG